MATRLLDPGERTRLLAAVVARFSTVALVSVAALVATGILQSIVHLQSFGDLISTGYGRAIAIKSELWSCWSPPAPPTAGGRCHACGLRRATRRPAARGWACGG